MTDGKRKIQARELMRDILGGMSEASVMEKYQLSSSSLKVLLGKLVDMGLAEPIEILKRMNGLAYNDLLVNYLGILESRIDDCVVGIKKTRKELEKIPGSLKRIEQRGANMEHSEQAPGMGIQRELPGDEEPIQKQSGHYTLKDLERLHVINVLISKSGNRTRAAKVLGITRRTLQHKLKQYDLETKTIEELSRLSEAYQGLGDSDSDLMGRLPEWVETIESELTLRLREPKDKD